MLEGRKEEDHEQLEDPDGLCKKLQRRGYKEEELLRQKKKTVNEAKVGDVKDP